MKPTFTLYTARQLKEPHTLHCKQRIDDDPDRYAAVVEVRRTAPEGLYTFIPTLHDLEKTLELVSTDELMRRVALAEEQGKPLYQAIAHDVVVWNWSPASKQAWSVCADTIEMFKVLMALGLELPITH